MLSWDSHKIWKALSATRKVQARLATTSPAEPTLVPHLLLEDNKKKGEMSACVKQAIFSQLWTKWRDFAAARLGKYDFGDLDSRPQICQEIGILGTQDFL